jgi:hypothetical protein
MPYFLLSTSLSKKSQNLPIGWCPTRRNIILEKSMQDAKYQLNKRDLQNPTPDLSAGVSPDETLFSKYQSSNNRLQKLAIKQTLLFLN